MRLLKVKTAVAVAAMIAGVGLAVPQPASASTTKYRTMTCAVAAGTVSVTVKYLVTNAKEATFQWVELHTYRKGDNAKDVFDVNRMYVGYLEYKASTPANDQWLTLFDRGSNSSADYVVAGVRYDKGLAGYPNGTGFFTDSDNDGNPYGKRLKSWVVDGVGASSNTNTCSGQVDLDVNPGSSDT